jgi:hypothetical protein
MSDATQVLALAATAEKRLEEAAEVNRRLSLMLGAQNVIIDGLLEVTRGDEGIPEKLESLTKEIELVNESLEDAKAALQYQLTTENVDIGQQAGHVLRTILDDVQNVLMRLSLERVSEGMMDLELISVLDLEQQLVILTEDLREKGMLMESEEENQTRMNAIQEHSQRILDFLESLVQDVPPVE